jgi:hypothetical protein
VVLHKGGPGSRQGPHAVSAQPQTRSRCSRDLATMCTLPHVATHIKHSTEAGSAHRFPCSNP